MKKENNENEMKKIIMKKEIEMKINKIK